MYAQKLRNFTKFCTKRAHKVKKGKERRNKNWEILYEKFIKKKVLKSAPQIALPCGM